MEEYSRYVGLMYERGYYVRTYNICTISEEVSLSRNKIILTPIISGDDRFVYIFTGIDQKKLISSDITEFLLYLEDENGEFKDYDNIMLSVIRSNDPPIDLYTRSYAQWKFGVQFDKGVHMDSDRRLIFQTQKEIKKFNIEINDIDLFFYKHKRRKEDFSSEMKWID